MGTKYEWDETVRTCGGITVSGGWKVVLSPRTSACIWPGRRMGIVRSDLGSWNKVGMNISIYRGSPFSFEQAI